jgi:DNA-directed RNA polymerase specialized sigma24 family protein
MQTETTPAQADVSELDLVKRCQEGDAEAFDELVVRYRTRVFGMIYNMVHSEQDAWDLAQDSFLKAWKSIKRFRGQSSFYTWIYRIVMNVTIDWLRKKAGESWRSRVRRFDPAKGSGSGFQDGAETRRVAVRAPGAKGDPRAN